VFRSIERNNSLEPAEERRPAHERGCTVARTALVIGAGVAGPVTAVALQRAGRDPVIYEAHDTRVEGVGAFLGLALNGLAALRTLDLDGPVLERGFATPRMVITNSRGRVLADFPQGGALPDGTRAITLARGDLSAALAEQAAARGIPVVRGRRLVQVESTGRGVRALFADGSSSDADVLVGADGIRSVTRRCSTRTLPARGTSASSTPPAARAAST
jgi:FAD-dependent urate hydroxylase